MIPCAELIRGMIAESERPAVGKVWPRADVASEEAEGAAPFSKVR